MQAEECLLVWGNLLYIIFFINILTNFLYRSAFLFQFIASAVICKQMPQRVPCHGHPRPVVVPKLDRK